MFNGENCVTGSVTPKHIAMYYSLIILNSDHLNTDLQKFWFFKGWFLNPHLNKFSTSSKTVKIKNQRLLCPRYSVIIDWPLNCLSHDARDVIITSRTDVRQLVDTMTMMNRR